MTEVPWLADWTGHGADLCCDSCSDPSPSAARRCRCAAASAVGLASCAGLIQTRNRTHLHRSVVVGLYQCSWEQSGRPASSTPSLQHGGCCPTPQGDFTQSPPGYCSRINAAQRHQNAFHQSADLPRLPVSPTPHTPNSGPASPLPACRWNTPGCQPSRPSGCPMTTLNLSNYRTSLRTPARPESTHRRHR